jgi:hypothetical protein
MGFLRRLLGNKQSAKWIAGEGTTVFACKALTPEAAAFAMFDRVVTLSSEDFAARIRREAQCPDAAVKVLEPDEWNAPRISGLAQSHIVGAFPQVVNRACSALRRIGVKGCTAQSLATMSAGAMPHPSGYVLFLFKVPGTLVSQASPQ